MALLRDGFGPGDYDDKPFYSYSKKTQKADKGRSSFIPASDSPGPAAYAPTTDTVKQAAPRAAFGTANRHNESARYISELHNKSLPAVDTPGPGTYRVGHESPKRGGAPSCKFGTADQRLDPDKTYPQAQIPGPIYSQELPPLGPYHSFAPMGSLRMGKQRSRYDDRRMFLSADHALADRSAVQDDFVAVGPGGYDVLSAETKMSNMRRAPAAVFGGSRREAGKSMTEEQIRHDPLSSSAADVPGAIYEYPSMLSDQSAPFPKGPQIYSPEKGPASAGPYISRGHEPTMRGTQGPGPGVYDVQGGRGKAVSGLGDAPQYPFGVLPKTDDTGRRRVNVPGPGAYNPKEEKTSSVPSAPGFSMAANLRTKWEDLSPKNVPGPGSYNVSDAAKAESKRSPAFSMGSQAKDGRSSFIPPSCTPGPGNDVPDAGVNVSPKRGFTFGVKDRTRDNKTTVGIRYLGPLAANEALGTQSPGPVYDTDSAVKQLSSMKGAPSVKMTSAARESRSKVFISRQHAEADGMGLDSPGPGAYDHHSKELGQVTSRFKNSGTAVFATSSRFNTNYSTF